jgi:hypothetical protein
MDSVSDAICAAVGCEKVANHQCAACGVTKYCGQVCQKAHWKAGHKAECISLASAAKMIEEKAKVRARLVKTIMGKWREQRIFVRFLNGVKIDCRAANLQQVPLLEALQHFDDWVVDWDMNLTQKELKFVKSDVKFRHLLT